MGQKAGEKWSAAVDLQPTTPKSDRLLGSGLDSGAIKRHFSPDTTLVSSFISLRKHRERPGAPRSARKAPTTALPGGSARIGNAAPGDAWLLECSKTYEARH